MAKPLALASLLALLALALWVAYKQWVMVAVNMPLWGWIALILGVGISVLVGGGLMALMFYSSRMGYDEPPRETDRERK
ncbi:MAG: hypothetical protein QOG83_1452 [Alphaproteobacteria bacterium]|nr:hypothetical protein [Alphaproteobacteria bacterium]